MLLLIPVWAETKFCFHECCKIKPRKRDCQLMSIFFFLNLVQIVCVCACILVLMFRLIGSDKKNADSPEGMDTLRYFLFTICAINASWSMNNVVDEEIKAINRTVGPEEHVICALSGGVDSTVAATLVHKAIGDRLHCVFVDNGLLT